MRATLRAFGVCALLGWALGGARGRALDRDAFVAGWPIQLPDAHGVFDVPLTLDVYRTARDLEQIAILDADGKPMPFYRVGAPDGRIAEERVTLAASPLYAAPPDAAVAGVSVASGADRTNVTLTRPRGDAPPEIVGFVVDARNVDRAPVAVELDWREVDRPFLIDVTIEHSAALTGWRTVGRGSAAELRIGGSNVRHARIAIAGERGGYYRIGASRSVPEWYVENVALIGARSDPADRESVRIAPIAGPKGASAGVFYFDAGGRLPVGSMTLDFGGANGWVRATVAAADALEGPWRTVAANRLFYAAELQETPLASAPVEIGHAEARYWRVEPENGTPAPQPFELELGVASESLRFAADGTPPYLLVAGTLAGDAGPDPTFPDVWHELEAAGGKPAAAALGARIELGGPAALEAPFRFPWRRAALWAVLGAAVAVIAWMALRLGRELRSGR